MVNLKLAVQLAREFSVLVQKQFSRADFDEILNRNKCDSDPLICHTHDFCDANELMETAFQNVMDHSIDLQNDEHCELWSVAWTIARQADYYA